MLKFAHMEIAKRTGDDRLSYVQRGPAGEILRLLQRNGPMSTKQLRAALGVSSLNAVREQLTSLMADGLVQSTTVRRGAGRPTHMYGLSDKAHVLFPQGYDVLLKLLLAELVTQTSQEQMQAILSGVSTRLAQEYGGPQEQHALKQRLDALVERLDQRGTPITLTEQGETVLLHEYSCPYFNVAQETSHVCGIEQRMLEQVLGRPVRLTQRIVDGHIGCQFVVDNQN